MSVPVHLVQVVRSVFKLKRYCCPYSWLVPESFYSTEGYWCVATSEIQRGIGKGNATRKTV